MTGRRHPGDSWALEMVHIFIRVVVNTDVYVSKKKKKKITELYA